MIRSAYPRLHKIVSLLIRLKCAQFPLDFHSWCVCVCVCVCFKLLQSFWEGRIWKYFSFHQLCAVPAQSSQFLRSLCTLGRCALLFLNNLTKTRGLKQAIFSIWGISRRQGIENCVNLYQILPRGVTKCRLLGFNTCFFFILISLF